MTPPATDAQVSGVFLAAGDRLDRPSPGIHVPGALLAAGRDDAAARHHRGATVGSAVAGGDGLSAVLVVLLAMGASVRLTPGSGPEPLAALLERRPASLFGRHIAWVTAPAMRRVAYLRPAGGTAPQVAAASPDRPGEGPRFRIALGLPGPMPRLPCPCLLGDRFDIDAAVAASLRCAIEAGFEAAGTGIERLVRSAALDVLFGEAAA